MAELSAKGSSKCQTSLGNTSIASGSTRNSSWTVPNRRAAMAA